MEEKKDKGNIFLPTEAIVLDMDPFLHCVIPNFIQSQDFLEGLQKELLSLDFHEKYNDLYKFQQVFIPITLALPPQTVLAWKTIYDCCSSRGPRFRSQDLPRGSPTSKSTHLHMLTARYKYISIIPFFKFIIVNTQGSRLGLFSRAFTLTLIFIPLT